MKRIPEPEVQRTQWLPKEVFGYPVVDKVVRKSLPLDWLLSELLLHITTICLGAYDKISVQMLLNNVLSMRDAETNKDALFNRTYTISYKKNQELYMKWEKTIPKETRDIWRGDTHMTMRNEAVPQYQVGVEAGNFLLSEYCHLPADLRAVTDLAFQGFLFSALNDLDFGSLCKDKGLDVSALTLEQKLDVELDHEALYARLLTQLGHA